MMNRKMKQLALAVGVALGGIGMLPSAQAVSVATDNLGQALIFPYYTVRDGWLTLFGVVNTNPNAVAVKVRFREAYNSRDVFDFNIILSGHDVWTGWVQDDPVLGPVLKTEDSTCTIGRIPAEGVAFTEFALPDSFVGENNDGGPGETGGPAMIDRLREGHVEMIMMGVANSPTVGVGNTACNALVAAFQDPTQLAALRALFPNYTNINPLKSTFSLVDGANGFNAVGLPVALANFRALAAGAVNTAVTLQLPPAEIGAGFPASFFDSWHEPSLFAANTNGAALTITNPEAVVNGGVTAANAVTFALSHKNLLNEWTRRTNPTAGWVTATDWVITYPTKNMYVDNDPPNQWAGRNAGRANCAGPAPCPAAAPANPAPFAQMFVDTSVTPAVRRGWSCDSVRVSLYDRSENKAGRAGFSGGRSPELCYQANTLTWADSNITRSQTGSGTIKGLQSFTNYPAEFLFGWMDLEFIPAAGLPAVGFAITTRDDSASTLLSEAALYDHGYIRP